MATSVSGSNSEAPTNSPSLENLSAADCNGTPDNANNTIFAEEETGNLRLGGRTITKGSPAFELLIRIFSNTITDDELSNLIISTCGGNIRESGDVGGYEPPV